MYNAKRRQDCTTVRRLARTCFVTFIQPPPLDWEDRPASVKVHLGPKVRPKSCLFEPSVSSWRSAFLKGFQGCCDRQRENSGQADQRYIARCCWQLLLNLRC